MKFDSEGIIKIFDFGLSRNEDKNAQTIGFKGTRGYAAPELIKHGDVEFSKAIDTYAFGSVAIAISDIKFPNELQRIPPQPLPDGFINSLPFLPAELAPIITSCLDFNPDNRPSMIRVRNEIERYLLKDKHQALAVHNNKSYVFNTEKRSVSLDVPNIGSLTINYDGLRFYISQVTGEVFINNQSVFIEQEIPKSSVITLGESYRGSSRTYITFDISNPEVVL
jgi:eukaryotic-like serine/threonine-protein kinase